jgi:hypothetical protein
MAKETVFVKRATLLPMKRIKHLFVLGSILFLGAGCSLTQDQISPQIALPIGQLFLDRPIEQVKGFGEIPKIPSPQLRPGVTGSVRVTAEMPSIPSVVTVLRLKSGRPNDAQLRNIASSFGIPGGAIGAAPISREMSVEWKDEQGIRWTYHGSERRLEFADESKDLKTLTVSAWPEKAKIMENTLAFLDSHGVNRRRLADPYIEPDWGDWWESQRAAGRCMSRQFLNEVRTLSATPLLMQEDIPTPPSSLNTTCVSPEFPSRVIVHMNATQDGQGIFSSNGTPVHGATAILDAATGAVVSGRFLAPVDPDRSDYPAISLKEASGMLARGGLGGTPQGDVTIDEVMFEWLFITDGSDPSITYLYPAFVGYGTILGTDKKTGPYRIVVPLVK